MREHSGLEEPSHRQPNPQRSSHSSALAYRCTNVLLNRYSEQRGSGVGVGVARNPTLMGSVSLSEGRAVTFFCDHRVSTVAYEMASF